MERRPRGRAQSKYTQRQAVIVHRTRRRRNPISGSLRVLGRFVTILSGWFIISRLWRNGAVGKIGSVVAALVWAIIVIAVLFAVSGTLNREPAGTSLSLGSLGDRVSSVIQQLTPFGSPEYVEVHERGYTRVGPWDVRLIRYKLTSDDSAALSDKRFEWLLSRVRLHNPTRSALHITDVEFTSTSLGRKGIASRSAVASLRGTPLPIGAVSPGATVTADVAVEVVKGAKTIKLTFLPRDSNPGRTEEIWTMKRS